MKIVQLLVCAAVAFSLPVMADDVKPAFIPMPDHVEWNGETFMLSNQTLYVTPSRAMNAYFTARVKELTGITLEPDPAKSDRTRIVMEIFPNPLVNNKEAYTLRVSAQKVEIIASSDDALVRAIQTFLQMIPASAKKAKAGTAIALPGCRIMDVPKFSWRGLNFDCARHFQSPAFIKRYIDILAYYKFNIFHWHLTDDQGWRIEIKKYPRLTSVGAWRKEGDGTTYGGFYTQDQIRDIVAYAQSRAITVVPEIEMPGHSLASLAAYPENSCTGGPFEVTNMWGVHKDIYCAGRESTYTFLQNVLDEVVGLFPGPYIHIGGDEAPRDRWKKCPKCQARIRAERLKNEHELQSYFIKRISKYLQSKGKEVIGWDEILQGGLAPGAIVQSWQSNQGAIEAAKLAHYTISSPTSHTYLDHDPDDLDLRVAYSFMPVPDGLTAEQRKYVIGSEANLWSEQAPQETVDSKLFPRLLALAEVFWNNPENRNYDEFYTRVQRSYDDLSALGIQYGRESKVITPVSTYDAVKKEFTLSVTQGQRDIDIRYTTDGTMPETTSHAYTGPITIGKTTTVTLAAFKNGNFIGKQYSLAFDFHQAIGASVMLKHRYDERYRAGGANAVVDGVRGTNNFRDGSWQGYEGVDFEGVIDLGTEKTISSVVPRFLLESNSYVFLPVKVEISLSQDNVHFTNAKTIPNTVSQKTSTVILKDFPAEYKQLKARYVKVKAESVKKCPVWHPGAGAPAWLFIDEIVVQ
ncbi:MAG TPA: family 20 glycosylhydrolase [Bacteroidota bacterium]|nr:family 20 glycosylhydrolase [Bacteroidota bacterium]